MQSQVCPLLFSLILGFHGLRGALSMRFIKSVFSNCMFVSEVVVVVTWAPSGYGGGVGSKRLREQVKL